MISLGGALSRDRLRTRVELPVDVLEELDDVVTGIMINDTRQRSNGFAIQILSPGFDLIQKIFDKQ